MNNIKIGDIVRCEVTGVTDYGIFVKLDNEYSGLVHISEISERFVSSVEKLYIIGDVIDAKVIEIDDDKKQIKLSIKKNKENRRKKKKIEEKGEGFKPLEENLNKWVEERLKELEKNAKTL